MENIKEGVMVVPGDRLGVEEEFAPSDNAYAEGGEVYASISGVVEIKDGRIGVRNPQGERRKIGKGMMVVGEVTDDLHSVVFVKISNIKGKGVEYMALKDGKIIAPKPRFDERGGGRFDRGGDRRGPPPPQPDRDRKLCGVGDIVLARVLFEEKDIFTLGIREPDTGVVYSECELCGAHLTLGEKPGVLVCGECKHIEFRKVSSFYDRSKDIDNLFENST